MPKGRGILAAKLMNIWGTTEDWAGKGAHKRIFLDGYPCCRSPLKRVECRGGDMCMVDRDTDEILEVWQCEDCFKVWFRRPGATGFFMFQPSTGDFMRGDGDE